MNWQEVYKSRQTSFEEVAQKIQDGDFVAMAFGPCTPSVEFYDAICDRWEELKGVRVCDALQLRKTRLYTEEFLRRAEGHIDFAPAYGSASIRPLYAKGLADYVGGCATNYNPTKMGEIVNVYALQVTPPNRHGYVNLGLSCFFSKAIIQEGKAKQKLRFCVAQVNDQMPTILGDNWVHVSEIDYFVEKSAPIEEFRRAMPGEVEKTIAGYVSELIHDGDTFQMGMGTVPEAIVPLLEGKKDLGVHSEMFPSGLDKLVAAGIVTNRFKSIHQGKTVASFCLGDKTMYDYCNENTECEFYSLRYVNNPIIIAQHNNMKTINQAIMVDFAGQVASEALGKRLISGPGGQPDFQTGAFLSKGGMAITVLTAARKNKDGSLSSSIVPFLPEGTMVTVPRTFVDTIVTEYGICTGLRNMGTRERALALIKIAHPSLRAELEEQAHQLFWPH
jgi:Acetyl-CoA hydrolase